jgi:DNA-binding XRE family transcriptional regulator
MARMTKADAARQLGISRTTLYKLIEQGKVSPTADGLIDAAELVRVAPLLDVHHERSRTPVDIVDVDAVQLLVNAVNVH